MSRDARMISRLNTLVLISAVLFSAVALFGAARAAAAVTPGFEEFTAVPSTTQAGGHPDIRATLAWNTELGGNCEVICLQGRVIGTHFPAGVLGNPHVAPKCTLTEFNQANCPVDSQIGTVYTPGFGFFFPLYNMETSPDQAGLLGATVPILGLPIFLEFTGRTNSDYGLDSIGTPLLRGFSVNRLTVDLWGVPADPVHNIERFLTPLEGIGACYFPAKGCPVGSEYESQTFAEPTVPAAPFLQNPTTCGITLAAQADIEYYGGQTAHAETSWPPTTGCKQLSFNPNITVKPTTGQADTPSGVDVDLKVPQTQSPYTPAPSELRTTRVTLPEGFTINPNAADGKVICPEADTGIGTLGPANCPEYAKVGTLTLDVAALPGPISGALYLGQPQPGDRYRLILTADGYATHVKLTGSVLPDPTTGRLTVAFEELPQDTLQEISMHFFGSERGLLATPTQCGTFPIEGEFVPWDSELTTRFTTSYMTIDSGPGGGPCPSGARPFGPSLAAGGENNTAGLHAPFSLIVKRADGEQNIADFTFHTPPGFTATLKGVPYCPEEAIAGLSQPGYTGLAEEASSACPAASQVGTAEAGVGAGNHPLFVDGKVYLAGPYKGAPLSLVTVLPAVSGPYDLGDVAVRAAVRVDPETAQVTAVADAFPQILGGVPIRLRSVRVDLNRPDFALNPTNCRPLSVSAEIFGTEGATADPSTPFQVANCRVLRFTPKLGLRFSGSLKAAGNPAVTAKLTYPGGSGSANIASTRVTLPATELIDSAHIRNPCTRVQFAANACPPVSVIGYASAETPLLEKPLEGPVYLRSSSHKLPDIVAALRGQINIDLDGRVDSIHQRIRTSFETVPDAPVSKFTLSLYGGQKGLLSNSTNLCSSTQRINVSMVGQNGKTISESPVLATSCGKKHKAQRKGTK